MCVIYTTSPLHYACVTASTSKDLKHVRGQRHVALYHSVSAIMLCSNHCEGPYLDEAAQARGLVPHVLFDHVIQHLWVRAGGYRHQHSITAANEDLGPCITRVHTMQFVAYTHTNTVASSIPTLWRMRTLPLHHKSARIAAHAHPHAAQASATHSSKCLDTKDSQFLS